MAGNPGAGKQQRKQAQPQQKKPAGPRPEPGRPGCYRDPSTGKFVCPPGAKPGARPAAKPSRKPAAAPAPTRKPPKGWFPMPDQRELLNRSNIARRGRSPRTA
jgi:hypothetical protein